MTAVRTSSQAPLLCSSTTKYFRHSYSISMASSYVLAIFQKAESLYHLGDFEHSLMYYHRGLRLRPELEGFRLGVQKAQEAIENTIGGKKLCEILRSNVIFNHNHYRFISGSVLFTNQATTYSRFLLAQISHSVPLSQDTLSFVGFF